MAKNTLPIFVCLALALSGCVPNASVYYRPSAEGGVVLTGSCVATESSLELVLTNNVSSTTMLARANEGGEINQVYLAFSGNEWRTISFTSLDFELIDLDKKTSLEPLAIKAHNDSGFSTLHTRPYEAQRTPLASMTRFSVQINLPEQMPENFDLRIPSLMLDSVEIQIPKIRFEREIWAGISPFNC